VVGPRVGGREIPLQLGDELVQVGVGAAQRLVAQVLDDVPTPLGQVLHPPSHAVGVHGQPQHVHWRFQQFGGSALGEHRQGRVGTHDLPVGARDDRGVGHVALEDAVEGLPDRTEDRGIEARFGGTRARSRGYEQGVSLPQRQAQRLGQAHHHRPPGARATLLQETHVALRRSGPHCQLELARSPERPPAAQLARETVGLDEHGPRLVIAEEPQRRYSLQGIAGGHVARQTRPMTTDANDATAVKDLQRLVDRYVALWNEPDPDARRKMIRELWAPDSAHVLVDPPEEVRDAADRLSFPIPSLEVHGYEALEARVSRGHEMFIAPGEYVFKAGGVATRLLSNVVSLTWTMVSRRDGEIAGGGLDVLALGSDGRIRTDYQFIGV
jgi:hypothetical protein